MGWAYCRWGVCSADGRVMALQSTVPGNLRYLCSSPNEKGNTRQYYPLGCECPPRYVHKNAQTKDHAQTDRGHLFNRASNGSMLLPCLNRRAECFVGDQPLVHCL